MPAQFSVNLERKNSKCYNDDKIKEQIDYITGRALAGNRSNWICEEVDVSKPKQVKDGWTYKVMLSFERRNPRETTADKLTLETQNIVNVIQQCGANSKFNNYPWKITEVLPNWNPTVEIRVAESADNDTTGCSPDEVVNFDQAIPLEEIDIPDVLLHGSDSQIENHPAFKGIYGRAAHIRVMFSSIKTMKDTKGQRRNHVILHGMPGCAKSSLFNGMQQVLPPGSFLSINANSATRAGIEAIFLSRLKLTGVPPFMFVEEIEKTLEAILTVWLSILDERAEVRKITHQSAHREETRILCFATANDKMLFDRLMGGRIGHPGALSSRFTKPLYVPRPDWNIMKRILLRDIALFGGRETWADKCIEIAQEIGTNDPRITLSFLDGGDRLETGAYKEDILSIFAMEKNDQKNQFNPDFESGAVVIQNT